MLSGSSANIINLSISIISFNDLIVIEVNQTLLMVSTVCVHLSVQFNIEVETSSLSLAGWLQMQSQMEYKYELFF